jgi:hypothetical protein
MRRKLTLLTMLVMLFYIGMFMDPVMFYISDLRASMLGQ